MRVVHVIAGIPAESGGPTQVLREMSARLAERGHDVTVLTTDSAGNGRRVAPGAERFSERVRVEMHRAELLRSPQLSLGHARALWGAAKAYDVAHVHGLFAAPPSLAMAAFRARGLPYVLRPCGMLDAYSLAQRRSLKRAWLVLLDRANLEGAARIQASTEHEADAVRAVLPARLHQRVVVLPQGVAGPGPPSGRRLHARPYVLFLSRVARKKGLLLLVEALARLPRDLDLVIAGPDEQGHRAEVEARVAALGLAARVTFTGAVGGPDKADWFAGAAVFALPSDDENFGVAVVEAAHLGVPVVVSDRVGLAPDVVRHGAGLVCARDPAALATALLAASSDRSRFASGLASLAAAYAWEPLIARLESLYREL